MLFLEFITDQTFILCVAELETAAIIIFSHITSSLNKGFLKRPTIFRNTGLTIVCTYTKEMLN